MNAFQKTDVAHGITANRAFLPDKCTLVYVNADGTDNFSRVWTGPKARSKMNGAFWRVNARIRAAENYADAWAAASTLEAQPGRPVTEPGAKLVRTMVGLTAQQRDHVSARAASLGMSASAYHRMLIDEDMVTE